MAADRTSRPWLATALAALCVLAAVVVGVVLASRQAQSEVRTEARDRPAVLEAARRFAVTWTSYSPGDASTYLRRVGPLMSDALGTEVRKTSDDTVVRIVEGRVSSEGEVPTGAGGTPLVGVASIDPESAEVLVAVDATEDANGRQSLEHWRWQMSLVKVDGTWRVDSFEAV